MRCEGSGLTHFDVLPNGNIVASARHSGTMDVLVYRANATTKQCEVERNLTNNTAENAIARDIALSPDKSTIAFFSGSGAGYVAPAKEEAVNVVSLFTVPVDGSRPAAQVPGATGLGDLGIGPRWVAGGVFITWGQHNGSQPTGALTDSVGRIASIPAKGGKTTIVTEAKLSAAAKPGGGTSYENRYRFGMGQGCSASPAHLSSGFSGALGLLGIAMLVMRRAKVGRSENELH